MDKLSKKKVVATVAQVEVVKASEHEAKMRLKMTWKLIEGIMTEDKPVGGELRRVRFPIEKKKSNKSFVDVLLDAEDFALLRARRRVHHQHQQFCQNFGFKNMENLFGGDYFLKKLRKAEATYLCWTAPPEGVLSLCCDGSYQYGEGVGGCGFVL